MKNANHRDVNAWHAASEELVLESLGVNADAGLDDDEIKRRQKRYGINRIYAEERASVLQYLRYCVSDLMLILLLITAVTAAAFGEKDMVALTVPILVFSIAVRTFAYIRAKRYLESSESVTAVMPSIHVLRGGRHRRIDSRYAVRGDIIFLSAGDIVPCDCRILSSEGLTVYEEGVTGAVGARHKSAGECEIQLPPSECFNMLYAGSSILGGRCKAAAVETGADTLAVRKYGELRVTRHGVLKLTKLLDRYSRIWGAVMTVIVFVITAVSFLSEDRGIYEVFFMGLSLAVASMCEYYTAIGDIAAAEGIRHLASGGSQVRGVKSIEALARLDAVVFGCDGVVTGDGIDVRCLKVSDGKLAECDNATDFYDVIYDAAASSGLFYGDGKAGSASEYSQMISKLSGNESIRADFKQPYEYMFTADARDGIPFDACVIRAGEGGYRALMNGDARDILAVCSQIDCGGSAKNITDSLRQGIEKAITYHQQRGALVIGIGAKNTPFHSKDRIGFLMTDACLIGLLILYPTTAPYLSDTVSACREAGITLIMTGVGQRDAMTAQRVGVVTRREEIITSREFAGMNADARMETVTQKRLLLGFSGDMLGEYISLMQKHGIKTAYVGDTSHDMRAELKLLHGVGASFALDDAGAADGRTERVCAYDGGQGVSQTLKMQADSIVPHVDDDGGGLPCVIECVSYAKKIYENVAAIADFLVTSQTARMFSVFFAIIFQKSALSPTQILIWGLIFDFFTVITIALERPDYRSLRRVSDVYEKLSHPLSGIGKSVVHGILWGSVTMLTALITCKSESDAACLIFISLLLSMTVVCGEHRSEYSVFSRRRQINMSSCLLAGVYAALIVLCTASERTADAIGIICPTPRILLLSLIPAAVILASYELSHLLHRENEEK